MERIGVYPGVRQRVGSDIGEVAQGKQTVCFARLMAALDGYGRLADEKGRRNLEQMYQACPQFEEMRKSLIGFYSQPRFVENPEGYIRDLNHHNHLSAKTNNGDWIFYYKKPMVDKMHGWIRGAATDLDYCLF